ncbi:Uncharacterised protein [Chlamydia trachomatis]|nr:Uncharacterised protein [Chlamydia trachomatis]
MRVLGQRGHFDGFTALHATGVRLDVSTQKIQQSCLSRAVDTDDADSFAGREAPGDTIKDNVRFTVRARECD